VVDKKKEEEEFVLVFSTGNGEENYTRVYFPNPPSVMYGLN